MVKANGRKLLSWTAISLLLIWVTYNWAGTVVRIRELFVTIPVWDYWRVAANSSEIQAFDFHYLWSQHNEHRIVFPDLVFALDVLCFHAGRVFPTAVSVSCYLGSWLVLGWSLVVEKRMSPAMRVSAFLLAGALIGWRGSTVVLAEPFLLQWTLLELSFLLGLLLIARGKSNGALAAAIGCGVVATYSSGNGLLIWPVLIGAAALCGRSKRQQVALGLSGLLANGLYFVNYRFLGQLNIATLWQHPAYTAGFAASYLSMPFGGMKSPQFGVYVGSGSMAVMAFLAVVGARSGLLRSRPGIVLFGSYLFTILTGLLTAAGRMDVMDPTYTNAKAERYLALLMINWGAAVVALLWIAAVRRWRLVSAPVLACLLAVLLGISFVKLRWWLEMHTWPFVNAQVTKLSLENGLTDPKLLRSIFPDPGFVIHYLPLLRQARLSIYYHEKERRPTTVLGSSEASSDGEVTGVYPIATGLEITGWAGKRELHGFKQVVLPTRQDRWSALGVGCLWVCPPN